MMLGRRNLIIVAVTDAVLFLLANVTIKSKAHPGTLSNVFWVIFLVGVLVLLLLGIATLVQSIKRRTAH